MTDEAPAVAGGHRPPPGGGRPAPARRGLEPDDAVRIAGECAELASQAAVELDRIARVSSSDPTEVPGQEELL